MALATVAKGGSVTQGVRCVTADEFPRTRPKKSICMKKRKCGLTNLVGYAHEGGCLEPDKGPY